MFSAFISQSSHLRGLGDAFAFSGALRVTEAAAGLHTAAGLHRQVETERDLRGRGSANANHTCHKRVCNLLIYTTSTVICEMYRRSLFGWIIGLSGGVFNHTAV